jgi:P-type Ca2+ transporter type 2C
MNSDNSSPEEIAAYRHTIDEVLSMFHTDGRRGLSDAEARERLKGCGKNELLAEKPVPAWKKFFAQYQNVLVILLLVATAISAGLWLYERESVLPYEAIAIFAVVLFNAVMGYIQESRAESALAALRRMSAAHAIVIRDGIRRTIPAADIVPGDIILIEEGDTIPADARVIHSTTLQTGEAALTGESMPVEKDSLPITEEVGVGDRENIIFSGTVVTYGHGRAAVTATGMQTEMGQIAGMLKEAPPQNSPLQRELARVGSLLGVIVVVIAVVMVTTILLLKNVTGFSAVFDVLILGIALAVAAVPEGLPAVVTAVLSLGVQRMAKRKAIVRNLTAVETLGSANVIASDKTGTLTKNEMTVRTIATASGQVNFSGTGYSPVGSLTRVSGDKESVITGAIQTELRRVLAVAYCANNAVLNQRDGRWMVQGDPTEGSLIVAARKAGLDESALGKRFERIGEVPFSSERKLMSTIHTDSEQQGRFLVFTKGAPDVLLARCSQELIAEGTRPITTERRTEILKKNEKLAGEALRTLGVAYRSARDESFEADELDEGIEQELIFAGLIGMVDPPRPEAIEAGRGSSSRES